MVDRARLVPHLAALAGGFGIALSFPDQNLWWAAPVGVALLGWATLGRGARAGFTAGLIGGLAYFVPTLSWSGVYVGKLPWFALATLQALYLGLWGLILGWAGRATLPRNCRWLRYLLIPTGWIAMEWARSTTPWGGFPWARLAFGQADGPAARLAAYGGAVGVSAAVAFSGAALLYAVNRPIRHLVSWRLAAVIAAVGVLVAPAAIRLPTAGEPVTVGFVQGNVPQAGLDFNAQRRAVLDNHVAGTLRLAQSTPADAALVVWPENASDIDPLRNSDAAAEIQQALAAVGVPIVVGAILAEPPGHDSNVSLLYRPGGGQPERYVKLHPVPFAEYVPYRSFFRHFSKDVDRVRNLAAGTTVGRFDVTRPGGGTVAVIPTICFEVAYDALVRRGVEKAGDTPSVLLVQTNNATFGFTAESTQQFAISRIRAIEHGRAVVHVSTVGVSGVVAPDGAVSDLTALYTADARWVSVPARSAVTLADQLGAWPERIVIAGFVLLVLALLRIGRRAGMVVAPPAKTPTTSRRQSLV